MNHKTYVLQGYWWHGWHDMYASSSLDEILKYFYYETEYPKRILIQSGKEGNIYVKHVR